MDKIEILTHKAARQFRHNNDNSPDMFKPEQGFVIAYDKDVIDEGLAELKATIKRQQDALEAIDKVQRYSNFQNSVNLVQNNQGNWIDYHALKKAIAKAEVK